ncbi:Plasmodium vivax Vir protein/Plasmodium variant antigen protein Cir/Yir/Bir, putative [Plasmodium ovale]|uniref:Plasmodium vivax Vir protein/Plasmodium variant antigen protein Cir/Yir/Bir, putative n=2 Tax=Plasmodium ovale TaxID=36330 RepID=A0A1C3KGF7_PLAOA|nr:Plasmodium vivax Vir protein/Plasmodium variant antigen protein Cir/Yir/Bir, putative [Plasmodium ovale]
MYNQIEVWGEYHKEACINFKKIYDGIESSIFQNVQVLYNLYNGHNNIKEIIMYHRNTNCDKCLQHANNCFNIYKNAANKCTSIAYDNFCGLLFNFSSLYKSVTTAWPHKTIVLPPLPPNERRNPENLAPEQALQKTALGSQGLQGDSNNDNNELLFKNILFRLL